MISPVFVLCSVLLITGSLADKSEKNNKYADAAKQAGMSLFTDLLAGKNVQQALLDRGMEGAGSLNNDAGGAIKSALKRVSELNNGADIEKVLSNAGVASLSKLAEKVKGADDIIKFIGEDNLKTILEGGAKALTNLFG